MKSEETNNSKVLFAPAMDSLDSNPLDVRASLLSLAGREGERGEEPEEC